MKTIEIETNTLDDILKRELKVKEEIKERFIKETIKTDERIEKYVDAMTEYFASYYDNFKFISLGTRENLNAYLVEIIYLNYTHDRLNKDSLGEIICSSNYKYKEIAEIIGDALLFKYHFYQDDYISSSSYFNLELLSDISPSVLSFNTGQLTSSTEYDDGLNNILSTNNCIKTIDACKKLKMVRNIDDILNN